MGTDVRRMGIVSVDDRVKLGFCWNEKACDKNVGCCQENLMDCELLIRTQSQVRYVQNGETTHIINGKPRDCGKEGGKRERKDFNKARVSR